MMACSKHPNFKLHWECNCCVQAQAVTLAASSLASCAESTQQGLATATQQTQSLMIHPWTHLSLEQKLHVVCTQLPIALSCARLRSCNSKGVAARQRHQAWYWLIGFVGRSSAGRLCYQAHHIGKRHGLLQCQWDSRWPHRRLHWCKLCLIHGTASVVVEEGSAAVGQLVLAEEPLRHLQCTKRNQSRSK